MKKFFTIMLLAISMSLLVAVTANAQLYAPCYANYNGVVYFTLPNGYYYGQIYAGYPQGEGYYYFVDPQLGPVYYHGYFERGLCSGNGEVISNQGYICGTWKRGDFVSQTNVKSQQMQQSYYNVWSNYWNYFANTNTYQPNYNWDWSQYSCPTYNYNYNYSYPQIDWSYYSVPQANYNWNWNNTPSYSTPANNYQATNNIKIPADTKITQIDSDTQLGRQLLRKIGR